MKTSLEENWDALIKEINLIEESIIKIEKNVTALNNLTNTMIITISSLIKILIDKKVVTEKELDKMANKMVEDLKKETKRNLDEKKDTDKKTFYDALLKSDFMANS